ncbi:hypothetical protein ACFLWA_07365 [Chloroflexota bacterium]
MTIVALLIPEGMAYPQMAGLTIYCELFGSRKEALMKMEKVRTIRPNVM